MPFCTYCGQSFTRDEHLERHILTHTNVKPYKCFTCHMSFARRDLLHRHYTVHGKDSSQESLTDANGMVPKSAGRTPIACHNCAKTKTKCDKKFPCTRCASRNLTCTVRPTRRTPKNAPQSGVSEDDKTGSPGESSLGSQTDSASDSPPRSSSVSLSPIAIRPSGSNVETSENHEAEDDCSSPMEGIDGLPEQVPGLTYNDISPLSEYDDFLRGNVSDSSDPLPSPNYMFEWQQVQAHLSMDTKQDLTMGQNMFDPNGLVDGFDDPTAFLPDFSSEIGNIPPQMTSPIEVQTFQFPPMTSPHPMSSSPSHYGQPDSAYHSRQSSCSEPPQSQEIQGRDPQAVVAARDGWSAFRCTPIVPSSLTPKTALLNLQQLEQTLKNHQGWMSLLPAWEEEFSSDDILVAPLQEMARDKLLAITQSFLHKALEIHTATHDNGYPQSPLDRSHAPNFLILPPARILHSFLRSYTNGFEHFYPMIAKGFFDPNILLQSYNDRAASLLVLLMIAQGAIITPSIDARELIAGLTETCRISLFDTIEKNILMASDPMILHSAMLFTVQAAWSGDKWQMDIAMGQRGMYAAMLRHSSRLEPKVPRGNVNDPWEPELLWNEWVEEELNSRLVYNWAMVDQDLSLFHDTAPMFSMTEFGVCMPDSNKLWRAKTVAEWADLFEQAHEAPKTLSSIGPRYRPLPLRTLFRHFLDDAIVAKRIELTPLHLRLLLHPLQSLVCQFRQLLSCFSDKTISRRGSKTVSAASTRARLEEVQMLLQRWYGLADKYMKTNQMCPLMLTNLVVFHLISLNAVTNFPEVERLARREDGERTTQQLHRIHKRCITDPEEAVFHCGQVMRHIRSMPPGVRPPWWAGAVYRATILLWMDSLAHSDALAQGCGATPSLETSFAIDSLPPHHPMIGRYLTKSEGTPTLTKHDGSPMPINDPFSVICYGMELIDGGVSTRFTDGIRSKLTVLASDCTR